MLLSQRRIIQSLLGAACCGILAAVAWGSQVKQSSIDLVTGRQRDRLFVLGVCFNERMHETRCSRLLQSGESDAPDWRVFSESGPLRPISPHFMHHSTPTMLAEVILIGDLRGASEDKRREVCARMLEYLRKDDPRSAKEVLNEWWKAQMTC